MSQNGFAAKVILDSVNSCSGRGGGERLTTLELTFPRFILPEFNTHRVFSRNSSSSRAIPVVKQLRRVMDFPFIPEEFGINKSGMQASENLDNHKAKEAKLLWLAARNSAVYSALPILLSQEETKKVIHSAEELESPEVVEKVIEAIVLYEKTIKTPNESDKEHSYLNVHKQIVNRLLEPFTWHTVIVTSTEWDNFWALRDNDDAQPEIHKIAGLAHTAYKGSVPEALGKGQWHLPFVREDEAELVAANIEMWKKISAGRCARVSYETHAGVRDINADVLLFDRLVSGGHMSPLEHIATPIVSPTEVWSGNFKGWHQWRKDFPFEDNFAKVLENK